MKISHWMQDITLQTRISRVSPGILFNVPEVFSGNVLKVLTKTYSYTDYPGHLCKQLSSHTQTHIQTVPTSFSGYNKFLVIYHQAY